MSEGARLPERLGVLHLEDIDWHFRVYLLRGDSSEVVGREGLFQHLGEKIRVIASRYLSDEFKYLRSGFALAHYGRRGVTYSFWHWADWVGTWEMFCQAWYCYGRSLQKMQPLDRSEPILCHHEVELVMLEAQAFRELAFRSGQHAELVQEYRECEPCSASSQEQQPGPGGTPSVGVLREHRGKDVPENNDDAD